MTANPGAEMVSAEHGTSVAGQHNDALPQATQARVAIIGAGNMGGAMVGRLCELGWRVLVCDIDPLRQRAATQAGADVLATPYAAASALADEGVLIICVVDAAQCHEVLWGLSGAAPALRRGQTVMLCPTVAPQAVEAMAQTLQAQGLNVIDAPMSGGPARARQGSMSLMLAGSVAVLAQHENLLRSLALQPFVVSERLGDAARTKLVNNLLAGINLAGAAEALALAQRLGLDLARTLDVIEASSGQSWIGSDRMRRLLAGDTEPRAHMGLLEKDTRLAVEAASAAGFEGPLGAHAAAAFAQASAAGFAHQDDSALLVWLRQRGTNPA